MPLKISFLFVFFFCSLNSFSQAKADYALIQFDSLTQNAGEIPQGPSHVFEFKFRNIGKIPIVIQSVKSSCGCLAPYWPKEPIMPGETGMIKGLYDTKNRPGNFHKTMTIFSNARIENNSRKEIYLVMKGVVIPIPKEATPVNNNSMIKN